VYVVLVASFTVREPLSGTVPNVESDAEFARELCHVITALAPFSTFDGVAPREHEGSDGAVTGPTVSIETVLLFF
jgi:hypothetical protein